MNRIKHYLIIVIFLFLGCISIISIQKLKFGYNLEKLFSKENKEYQFYKKYKSTFGNENNFLMIAFNRKENYDRITFLRKIDSISRMLKTVKPIKTVLSPTTIKQKIKTPLVGYISRPIITINSDNEIEENINYLYKSNSFYTNFFTPELSSILVYLEIPEDLSKPKRNNLLRKIKKIVNSIITNKESINIHYAGQMNTQSYYVNTLNKEVVLFTSISILLLILFLFISYRSLHIILYSLTILVLSILFTFYIINIQLGELDFLMTMVPTLLFVIGIANVIHFLSSYKEFLEKKLEKNIALLKTIKEAGTSTFISSLTTAIGFFSLYFLPSNPIKNFGIYSGVGILITWIITILLLPSFIKVSKRLTFKKEIKIKWELFLENKIVQLFKNKKNIIFGTVALLIFSFIGMFFITPNSFFLDDLNDKSILKKDLIFFENNFGGIRPFELAISTKNKSDNILSLVNVKKIEEINTYLENEYHVSMSLSINTLIKESNLFNHSGNADFNTIPGTEKEFKKALKITKRNQLNKLIDSTFSTIRITGKIKDLGSYEMFGKNKKLLIFLKKYEKSLDINLTGIAHLMDAKNFNVSFYLIKGLLFSLLIVTLIIAIALKSIKMALFSLIPNFIPLFFTLGVMGWLQIDFKISTALIFTIIFGIAVDDTIHFLMRYRSEKNRKPSTALIETYKHSGKKLILTTFILSSGFLAFTLSDFNSTFYAGFLITLGLIVALLSDLILLPILINLIEKKYE